MPQAVDDDSYEDLLSLWSDLESGMGILLGHPASVQDFPRKIAQYDHWMQALLQRWGVQVALATTVDEALSGLAQAPHVVLVDYHLHDRMDGLETLEALCAAAGRALPGALLTGDGSDALNLAARARGYRVLTKPIRPASLRAFLAAQPRHSLERAILAQP